MIRKLSYVVTACAVVFAASVASACDEVVVQGVCERAVERTVLRVVESTPVVYYTMPFIQETREVKRIRIVEKIRTEPVVERVVIEKQRVGLIDRFRARNVAKVKTVERVQVVGY